MKTFALSFLLFLFSISLFAQDQTNLVFKGYISVSKPFEGNVFSLHYNDGSVHIGDPSFALAIIRAKGNYHQIELADISMDIHKQGYLIGSTYSDYTMGFRYSYNIELLKSKNGKLKTFIAPAAHLLTNYETAQINGENNYHMITVITSLEVIPVISYQIATKFSIEANFPITLFGAWEEFSNHEMHGTPFLGPKDFLCRIGVTINL